MKFKCDTCGHEFELDGFPPENYSCPACGSKDTTFSIVG